jgi:hypothetical protein
MECESKQFRSVLRFSSHLSITFVASRGSSGAVCFVSDGFASEHLLSLPNFRIYTA